ncbi:MAG: S8 family serine peptidase, partial [Methanomicrobiales archaeon]|nr:S8 family serine peptidase [Methanomicrobiales archaeon]
MAAPFVSGLAALIKAKNPSLNATQIKNIIIESVDTNPSLQGKILSGGRINASRAVQMASDFPVGPPSSVTNLRATAVTSSAITWE